MKTNSASVAAVVFETRAEADRAVQELRAAGFGDVDIGVGGRPGQDGGGASGPPTWENGAGIGGLSGAALGGLAAGPPGMAAGALVGLLVGAMIDLGIPEQDARWYAEAADAGKVVVTARAAGRREEAQEILERNGGREYRPASPTA